MQTALRGRRLLSRVAFGSALAWLALAQAASAQPKSPTATAAASPDAPNGAGAPAAGTTTTASATTPTTTPVSGSTPTQPPSSAPPNGAGAAVTADNAELSPLRKKIAESRKLAEALIARVWALKGNSTLAAREGRAKEEQINALTTQMDSFDERASILEQHKASSTAAGQAEIAAEQSALQKQVQLGAESLAAIGTELEAIATASGWNLVDKLLSARCSTAICFDNGQTRRWLGIEPLVELPIGIGFAVSGSSLADYVNNHDLRVDLAAGVRVWLFRDVVSLSVYISKALADTPVRLRGSDFVFPGSAVRRPYPGLALGFLFDSIWVGFDRNELRNGDGKDGSALNPDFPPNQVVSSAWTLTLALQPVTAFRTAIGAAVQSNQASSP